MRNPKKKKKKKKKKNWPWIISLLEKKRDLKWGAGASGTILTKNKLEMYF